MNKRILLTGVTGFLGSHLAKSLLKIGYEVVALKRRSSSMHRIECVASEISLYDIEDLDFYELFSKYEKIDAIIHTATSYGRNNESVSDIFLANTEFPLKLLDAGARAGIGTFLNTDTILDKYLNLYALSKNQLLQWGKFFSLHQKIHFGNIKLEHFYGPHDDVTKFTTYIINNCMNNTLEINLTEGEQKRDFIYIDDVVSAYITILQNIDAFTNYFFEFDVGTGKSISIKEFVRKVHGITASTTNLNFGSLPYREGEVMHSEADISGLRALGWQCRYDVDAGLKLTVQQQGEK